jgi:glycosyltransferase involved in cell wall biosynthesis
MSEPRVSVLIAAYNAAAFIERTLRTVLDQAFTDLEVLVIDDGSSDGTGEIVRRAIPTDARVRLVVQENRGLSATRNRGIAEARGDLIAFLDHDDVWQRDKLALQVAVLDAHPEVGVVSCFSALVDENMRCLGWRFGGDASGDVYAEMLEWDIVSGGSVVVVRRTMLEAAGPFDETLAIREDWDMWIRLARLTAFATVPRVLVGYTRCDSNVSRDYERLAVEGLQVLEKVRAVDPTLTPARHRFYRARDLFAAASFCAVDGQVALAWHYVWRSLAMTPLPILRAPRRWAFVGVLGLQTVLPAAWFQRAFGWLARRSFQLEPGRPFLALGEEG